MLSENGIRYKIHNSTTIEVSSDNYILPVIENRKIVELKIKNESIKLGHGFKFPIKDRKVTYEINYINKIDNKTYLLQTEKKNKTTQYILPILEKIEIPYNLKKDLEISVIRDLEAYCTDSYCINAYLGGTNLMTLDGYLYLKYRFSPHVVYQSLEQCLMEHPLFIKIIDQKEEYTYYKFVIPKEYLPDLQIFLQGIYTELSPSLKHKITKFYNLRPESSLYQILTGGDKYREQLSKEFGCSITGELESIPDILHELILV